MALEMIAPNVGVTDAGEQVSTLRPLSLKSYKPGQFVGMKELQAAAKAQRDLRDARIAERERVADKLNWARIDLYQAKRAVRLLEAELESLSQQPLYC